MSFLLKNGELKEQTKHIAMTVLITCLASALMSIEVVMMVNPIGLYSGGTTGLAQILLRIFGLIIKGDSEVFFNYLGIVNFILLFPFNILAFMKLSKKYAIYTFISSVVQTIVFQFSDVWKSVHVFATATENADGSITYTYSILACVIVGAAINGICNGSMMKRGSTSGGFITLCQYLNIKKGKSVGFLNTIVSAVILVCGFIISFCSQGRNGDLGASISTALYTLTYFVLCNIVLDHVHTAYNKMKIEVVTEKGKEMIDTLLKLFPHGITITHGTGAFSGNEKTILTVVLQSNEMTRYFNTIKEIDKNAFVSAIPIQRFSGRFRVQIIDK